MSLSDDWEQESARWIEWARSPGHDSYWRFHRDQFLELLPPPGRQTVDVGCGEGRLPRDLARLGHRVIGVDVSATLIDAARKSDPDGDYRCANAAKLPLEDGSCDLVTAFMSLHDVDDLPAAVEEIDRVLMNRGIACIAVVHPLNSAGSFADASATSPFVIKGTYLGEFGYSSQESRNGLRMTFHSRHRSIEAYSRIFEASGFLIEAIREPPVPTFADQSERSERWRRIPLFLHFRVRKGASIPPATPWRR